MRARLLNSLSPSKLAGQNNVTLGERTAGVRVKFARQRDKNR
jgi:hypothetical protein